MPSEYDLTRARAQCLLARREHSRLELQQKLVQKGFDADLSKKIIADLAEEGLQSDDRFVESYIRMRTNSGFGPIRIRYELKNKGIADEKIHQSVTLADKHWFDNAGKVLSKKFDYIDHDDIAMKSKQVRFLQYRGFTQDQIKSALSHHQAQ